MGVGVYCWRGRILLVYCVWLRLVALAMVVCGCYGCVVFGCARLVALVVSLYVIKRIRLYNIA